MSLVKVIAEMREEHYSIYLLFYQIIYSLYCSKDFFLSARHSKVTII
jgi:hypothetical protein